MPLGATPAPLTKTASPAPSRCSPATASKAEVGQTIAFCRLSAAEEWRGSDSVEKPLAAAGSLPDGRGSLGSHATRRTATVRERSESAGTSRRVFHGISRAERPIPTDDKRRSSVPPRHRPSRSLTRGSLQYLRGTTTIFRGGNSQWGGRVARRRGAPPDARPA